MAVLPKLRIVRDVRASIDFHLRRRADSSMRAHRLEYRSRHAAENQGIAMSLRQAALKPDSTHAKES
jgi:hypothetical protein